MIVDSSTVNRDLLLFAQRGLLAPSEAAQVLEVLTSIFPFSEAMESAESIHVHITVDDVQALPDQDVLAEAAAEVTGNNVERKFAFASGLNVVFASEPTAQDELIPGAETRAKPYVDHLGVDLRDVNETTEAVFSRIPNVALSAGWRHVYQEGPVRCCHVEMGPKHWVYPPEGPAGTRRPIEFAFGNLKASDKYLGCDYRPIDPAHPLAPLAHDVASCDGAESGAESLDAPVRPHTVYVFEERSCNTSPSRALLDSIRERYGAEVDVRAFDLARPEGLLPIPPSLFMQLQTTGFGILPALVVDGVVRTVGWVPDLAEAVRLIEVPEQSQGPVQRPGLAPSSCCGTDGSCC